jgi:hypothetical protein
MIMDWSGLGKLLLLAGGVLFLLGAALVLAEKWPGGLSWLGRLPGDILIKRDHFTFYFPLATSILISVIVSLALYFLTKR